MKRMLSLMIAVVLVIAGLCFQTQNAAAEEEYTLIAAGQSMAEAPNVELNRMYASSLTGKETVYFSFTTPEQKGYIDFYCMNVTISTHSWSANSQVNFDLINDIGQKLTQVCCGYGGSRVVNIRLRPSTTYYVRVHNPTVANESATGNLKFKLRFTSDLNGDGISDAEKIRLSKTHTASMDGQGDRDEYAFFSGEFENFVLTAKNVNIPTHSWASDSQFCVRIENTIGEILAEIRLGKGASKSVNVSLQPGKTYYVYAFNPTWSDYGTGNYTFCVDPVRTPLEDATFEYTREFAYTGREIKPTLTITYQGTVLRKGTDYTVSYSRNIVPGTGRIAIAGKGRYSGKVTLHFNILKADQPMRVKAAKAAVSYTKLKSKRQVIRADQYLKVTKAQGKVSYSIHEAGKLKGVKVNSKTGEITVPKGAKKGTYTVQLKVKAAGDKIYCSDSVIVSVKIVVR